MATRPVHQPVHQKVDDPLHVLAVDRPTGEQYLEVDRREEYLEHEMCVRGCHQFTARDGAVDHDAGRVQPRVPELIAQPREIGAVVRGRHRADQSRTERRVHHPDHGCGVRGQIGAQGSGVGYRERLLAVGQEGSHDQAFPRPPPAVDRGLVHICAGRHVGDAQLLGPVFRQQGQGRIQHRHPDACRTASGTALNLMMVAHLSRVTQVSCVNYPG